MNRDCLFRYWVAALLTAGCPGVSASEDLTKWQPLPSEFQPAARSETSVSLQHGNAWAYLRSPEEHSNVEISATVTIVNPATQFDFFGSTWSAWPDAKFEDRGFEAAFVLRGSIDGSQGYRVQLSSKYQEIALVRFPEGGYVRSVPCTVKTQTPIRLRAAAAGRVIRVWIDDQELIRYNDPLEPGISRGGVAVGTSSAARVTFSDVAVRPVEAQPQRAAQSHQLRLTARKWLGGRVFIFDDNEPILQLHYEGDPSCFAKLMPGDKPRLSFDSHWGLENQGAFPEAKVEWTAPAVSGGGETIQATWSARHINNRFVTKSSLVVGYDTQRGTYAYDIDSELEVLAGEPFQFRYGFDFEHHTPLDPFRWQYLLIRDRRGEMRYRPLSPFDPGTLDDIESSRGLRVWHGRNADDYRVSPAVEYAIPSEWQTATDASGTMAQRVLNTAVCAAFYDTGVSYPSTTAKPGDRIRVKYRYTGYQPSETAALFASARVQDNPRIDPQHHFVFAGDQWPTIRFTEALAMDKPWWGGRPFFSAHNARPTYDWVTEHGERLLRMGPVSYALAPVGPARIEPGRYLVSARIKSVNACGPGGRIELLSLKKSDPHGNGFVRLDAGNILSAEARYFGKGTFDWREVSFVAEVPVDAAGLALGLGNAGTGEVFVSQVKIEPLGGRQPPSEQLAASPPPAEAIPHALWDLRMDERQGLYVFNYGLSTHRTLELANVDWVEDEGRSAIRFADNPIERADFPVLGTLDLHLRNPNQRENYERVRHVANAIGGGPHEKVDTDAGFTLAAWIKPAAAMGRGEHGGKGDIVGFGSRSFILSLNGQAAPYTLLGRINANERFESKATIEAGRWYHVAMTCQPMGDHWRIRLYVDGDQVAEGKSTSLKAETTVSDSIVLGAELFYLHDAYYRGLISRVIILRSVLDAESIRSIAHHD